MAKKSPQPQSPQPARTGKRRTIVILVVAIGLCLCLSFFALLQGGTDKQTSEAPEKSTQEVGRAVQVPLTSTGTPTPIEPVIPTDTPASTDTPAPTDTALPIPATENAAASSSTSTPTSTSTSLQKPVSAIFADMTPAPYSTPRMFAEDWENKPVGEQFISVQLQDLITDTVPYRPYFVSAKTPTNALQAICPAPYQTIWYIYEATGSEPITVDYGVSVNIKGIDDREHFFSVSTDSADLLEDPFFEVSSPAFVVLCADPQNVHDYSSTIISPGSGRKLSCRISIVTQDSTITGDEESETGDSVGCVAFDPDATLKPAAKATQAPLPSGPVANRSANLRAGPSTDFPTDGSVGVGDPLDIVATNAAGDWLQLASGAWIARFLVDNVPESLPVSTNVPTLPERSGPAVPLAPTSTRPYAQCDCSGDLFNCGDFASPYDAQACFNFCGGTANDVHRLDRDGDGNACEWEP